MESLSSRTKFSISRNISYYATGTFRGVGVRDTAQDILAMIPFNLRRAKNKLNYCLHNNIGTDIAIIIVSR